MRDAFAIWYLDMSGSRPNRPAVVVLGSGHHGGLAIARSLGRLGIPVYSADVHWWETGFSSRYCHGRVLFDPFADNSALPVRRLLEI